MEIDLDILMILTLLGMLIAIFSGVHIALALGATAMVGTYFIFEDLYMAASQVGGAAYELIRDHIFMTIPLFVLMGDFLSRSGAAGDLYTLINKGLYDGSAFYKVIENTLVQAGDLEYGKKEYLDYSKIGSGKSKLGTLKSELNDDFEFTEGSVGFARSTEFNTEDSEFFITLKEIPIYQGEYTPLGKVIYGLDILERIKTGNKAIYVLRPDFINSFKMLNAN